MPETSIVVFGSLDSLWPVLVLVAVTMFLMYLGRAAAHSAVHALGRGLQGSLRLAAEALGSVEARLRERNREVLLEQGREASERMIEREFCRVNAVVARDLSGYPALHRRLCEQITRIDEDYRAATEVPPSPPEWVRAVEAIAAIPSPGDPVVVRVLGDIRKLLADGQKTAMNAYRRASAQRHRLLERMLPYWRRLDQTLSRIDGTIRGFDERARAIDRQMEQYEQILARSDAAVRRLSGSSFTHFASSTLVLAIALLGGFINFHLIALPMSEMVGATSHVGPVQTSDIAALVIIFTEVAMGLFLMESLRITRLFPVIGMMDDQLRRRMLWASFAILFTLACVEASLAYMRDLLATDKEALTLSLAGLEAAPAPHRWIPSVGQMVMGFMLPFALAFAAIPLESFLHSSRIVFGSMLGIAFRALAGLLGLLGSLAEHVGPLLTALYDLFIVVPLRLEQLLARPRPRTASVEGTGL